MKFTQVSLALLVAVAVFAGTSFPVQADHSWFGYHWNVTPKQTLRSPITIGDNLSTPSMKAALQSASADWNMSIIKNKLVSGRSNVNCDPVSGRIEVCNGNYGENGWLGLAQVWIAPGTDGHITQGTVRMNETYFSMYTFDTDSWKTQVMCQEIAHTIGLDHQDEDFENANIGTCMDYTNDPDGSVFGQLSNLHPNQHDYDMISAIYTHTHGKVGKPRSNGVNVPANVSKDSTKGAPWGLPVRKDGQGKNSLFVKENEDGSRVVTHVLWK